MQKDISPLSPLDLSQSISPFQLAKRMEREMNQIFDNFFTPVSSGTKNELQTACPSCEIEDKNDHFLVSVDLPGVKKDDINIEVLENKIMISGERKSEKETKNKDYHYSEKSYGNFQRTFNLPQKFLADKIEANFDNGVLHLSIPKAQATQPKKIDIKTEKNLSLKK